MHTQKKHLIFGKKKHPKKKKKKNEFHSGNFSCIDLLAFYSYQRWLSKKKSELESEEKQLLRAKEMIV
jgi:hypothetical protein